MYVAQMLTSGNDNDWGFGINQLADNTWFCDRTLRISPMYKSVTLLALSLIIFGVMLISIVSFTLRPLLWLIVTTARETELTQSI